MTRRAMSSRQRMLAAITGGDVDHVPCSFMMYRGLWERCATYEEFIERQIELGLDTFVQLPPRPPGIRNDWYNLHGLPVSHDPSVRVRESIEQLPGETYPLMIKEYATPAGTLRAEVWQTPDWRWGDHVPFLDDYIEPRSRKFLIDEPADLEALRYLLTELTSDEVAEFREASEPVLGLARDHDLLVAGGWGIGVDLLGWVFGLERLVIAVYEQPAFIRDLLDLVASWNAKRMEVVLDAGVDLYLKRAWYENLDFWTPATWREFILPTTRAEVELAHARGALFGYIMTSDCMDLLPLIREAGVDVIIGLDPRAWDMREARRRLGGDVALWGGVNGHLTVEQGSSDDVRAEVRAAIDALAATGFILSPVDNVRHDDEATRTNVAALIDEWRDITT
ncbi:MAG: uroporphyrinogen decarboxylase family protein [Chloroflexota bacterium]